MPNDTVFHKILAGAIPAKVAYQDEEVLAFHDIRPKAATHLLFIPKHFIESIAHVTPETAYIPGMLILKAQKFAKEQGIDGYKLQFNVGAGGGQEVPYLHLHLISEQKLKG
jgi:histidine triad (HIT) family protein